MPSKEAIINKLIKLVAGHLQKHCASVDECADCKYFDSALNHCKFCDIPFEWEVDKLDGSDD